MLGQSVAQAVAFFDILGHLARDAFQFGMLGPLRQNAQAAHQRNANVEQRRQLSAEYRDILQFRAE